MRWNNRIKPITTRISYPTSSRNNSLKGFSPVLDETTGEITGYTTEIGGADTVFPFKSGGSIKLLTTVNTATTINMSSHMSDYKSLDASNFLCVVDGGWADSGVGEGKNLSSTPTLAPVAQATFTPAALSYDPTTGELSITPAKLSGTGGIKYTNDHSWYKVTHCNTNLSTTVYLVE